MSGQSPPVPRYYQQPPVMRMGVSQMETVGHVFLIPIFEIKKFGRDFEYIDADDDNKLEVKNKEFVISHTDW